MRIIDVKHPSVHENIRRWASTLHLNGFEVQTSIGNEDGRPYAIVEGIHWGRQKKIQIEFERGQFYQAFWGRQLVTPSQAQELVAGEKEEL